MIIRDNLSYNICSVCGTFINEDELLCDRCKSGKNGEFNLKKAQALKDLYTMSVDEPPGYDEKVGTEALKDLLREIRNKSDESIKKHCS